MTVKSCTKYCRVCKKKTKNRVEKYFSGDVCYVCQECGHDSWVLSPRS